MARLTRLTNGLELVILLTAAFLATVAAFSVSSSTTTRPAQDRPYVGSIIHNDAEFIVIGTSHFRCKSAEEVKTIIEEEQPDAVIVELDPERVVRLTKEYAMTNPDQDFGADFLSAIQVAQDRDIPLFLGDEYTQATKTRFWTTLLSPATYNPSRLLAAVFPKSKPQVDIIQTFLQDPQKAVPLVTTLSLPFLVALVCLVRQFTASTTTETDLMNTNNNLLEVIVSLILSALISTKVFNTLIADRDDVLASNSLQAAKAVQSLKRGETIRKTWRFTVDGVGDNSSTDDNNATDMIPLFTLKTPLEANAVRNLNLFEPRWLAMIDSLSDKQDPKFGCVTCTNKFYSVVKTPDGHEGRYADVIFRKQGRMAKLLQLQEGSRPSGARKISTQIQGEVTTFSLPADGTDSILVSKEGYLMAPNEKLVSSAEVDVDVKDETSPDDNQRVKVVVVVGLLHANGVIGLLSQRMNEHREGTPPITY